MKAREMAKSGLSLVAAELMIVLSVSVIFPLVGAFIRAPLVLQ